MDIPHTLKQALRSFLMLKKRREEPWWARLLIAVGLALAVTLALLVVSVFLMGKAELAWWSVALSNNLLFGICAAASMLLLIGACEKLLPQAWINALSAMQGWRPIALMSAILFAGAALGVRAGYALLGQFYSVNFWQKLAAAPMVQLKFAIFAALILAANWVWWQFRAKEKALAQQAAESQLRMLQAQIEPHFLFNTLANVQSLIATDAPRAQLMLETFTDYLRASLGQMRAGDSSLGAELDTAHNYLLLMQIRMGSRLAFSIDVGEGLRQALMPPLLLQPLVENAVQHGVGPRLEGGHVRISAAVRDGLLEIVVDDDGVGLGLGIGHPRRAAGNGMALINIRARLDTGFGAGAALDVAPLAQGTRATMSLPFRPAFQQPA
ncbi:MAG TPA: histidine kinase [Telluria sp.]|jgi:two-component sensor histidine kinase